MTEPSAIKRILLIEDEEDVGLTLNRFLKKYGYELEWVSRSEDAEVVMRNWTPDLVLLDYQLPGENGDIWLTKWRKQGHQEPVILITGFLDEDKIAVFDDLALSKVLYKPILLGELLNSIKTVEENKDFRLPMATSNVDSDAQSSLNLSSLAKQTDKKMTHSLANRLGKIRLLCEQFILDYEDGLLNADPKVSLDESIMAMRTVMRIVDEIVGDYDSPTKVTKAESS